jgi:hypothetical protein
MQAGSEGKMIKDRIRRPSPKRAWRGREGEGLRFYQEHVSVFEKRRKEMVGNPARGQMENCLNLDFNDYRITLILAMINFSAR